VYFTVVSPPIEQAALLPAGPVYRLAADTAAPARVDETADWRRFRARRTLRGEYATRGLDENTRTVISYYVYAEYRRGFVLSRRGKWEEAMAIYRAVLAEPVFSGIGPAAAHASAGECLMNLGRPGEAIDEYEEAVRLAPDWVPGLKALADACLAAKRHDKAWRAYRQLLKACPGDQDAVRKVATLAPFSDSPDGRQP
jgi:tetratricopeptide (TPR) repeat protein